MVCHVLPRSGPFTALCIVSPHLTIFFSNLALITFFLLFQVPEEKYKAVSSNSRAAVLFGKFMSGLLSQLLSSLGLLDYSQLNYVSFACVALAFLISVFLPRVTTSIYFHTKEDNERVRKLSYKLSMKGIYNRLFFF